MSTQPITIDPTLAEHLAVILERIAHDLRQSAGTLPNALALLGAGEQVNGEAAVNTKRTKRMIPTTTSTLMTAREAAALLRLDARTLRRMWRASEVPAPIRLGRGWRWRRRDIEKWIEEQVAR